jgi:hypothetical protein
MEEESNEESTTLSNDELRAIVRDNNFEKLKCLYDKGFAHQINNAVEESIQHSTLLHLAAKFGHVEVSELLITNGISVNTNASVDK